MKSVVFGGAGFLGSHVCDALTDSGFDVTVFDIRHSDYLKENQAMVVGDMLDEGLLDEVLNGVDIVYHFAGIADIHEAKEKPIQTVEANILSTVKILEYCRKYKIKRFVFASTIYVYSEHGSFYRSSKQAAELFIENFHSNYGIDYTILRFGSLYGKRANHFNFINNIIVQAILEKKIVRQGNGEEIREYVNVLDAARASVKILGDEYNNSYVLITGMQTMKVKDLLNMIREIFKNEIDIIFSNNRIEEHYEITPYSFRPKVAKKFVLDHYHDLGQGILDLIYEKYNNLSREYKLDGTSPKSAEY